MAGVTVAGARGEAGRHRRPPAPPPTPAQTRGRHRREVAKRAGSAALFEFAFLAVIGIGGAMFLRVFAVQAFFIPSGSMETTLHGCTPCSNNDRILVDKLRYRWTDIKRGDIVVVHSKGTGWETMEDGDIVKRVIALPGETVAGDKNGQIRINGVRLIEPYKYLDGQDGRPEFGPTLVPPGSVYLMGDHRNDSTDSRVVGPIPETNIVGKAVFRFWPLKRIGGLH